MHRHAGSLRPRRRHALYVRLWIRGMCYDQLFQKNDYGVCYMKKINSLRPSAAAFFLMMAMAITTSALSFFVSPVCAELGIGRGSFVLYYSIMTASGAVSTSFLGQYINRKGVRNVIFISAIWCFCGLMLFSFSSSLWMFYGVAVVMGFFCTSCMNLCANVIVQTSYSSDQASNLLGFVMAGSGVGGMVFSVILPGILEKMGWRFGYRFLAVCWIILVMSAFFLIGKQKTADNIGNRKTPLSGMSRAEALRTPKFYLMMVTIVIYTAACGIQQQVPSLLGGMQFSTAQVSMMVSVLTASLAVGKIFQGMLYARIGISKGGIIMSVLFGAGFLLLINRSTVYPGLVALAFGMGTVTTLMPTSVRFVFGAREYASIWSVLATASSIGSFIATPVWGMIYDSFGSYVPGLIVMPILLMIGLTTMTVALRNQK